MAQEIVRGAGCIREAGRRAVEAGFRSILVVHGGASFRNAPVREVLDALPGVRLRYFSDLTPNPDTASVGRCLRALEEAEPDLVFAVGGGSVMDTAKGALAFSSGAAEADILAGRFSLSADRPGFWAAPTTAGSGSEATHFAVLYRGVDKFSLADRGLKPDLVFLDPALTVGCPPRLTLASGADAVCQAVESYWSAGRSAESRSWALSALPLLLENLFRAAERPGDLAARTAMLEGAHLAGRAIDVSKTTAAHAMSYGLTSRYGMQHGLAVLACMGPLVELMGDRGALDLSALDGPFAPYGGNFWRGFAAFRERVFGALDGDDRTPAAGENADTAARDLVRGVNAERLGNHPVYLSAEDLERLYEKTLLQLGAGIHA